jgi:hypothetical protein
MNVRRAVLVAALTAALTAPAAHGWQAPTLQEFRLVVKGLPARLTSTRWTKIGEGSFWSCRIRGVPTRVIRDLFGGCAP